MGAGSDGPADVLAAMMACWRAGDVDGLVAHVADDLDYLNSIGWHFRGKAEAREGWTRLLASPMAAFPAWDERYERFLADDVALVVEIGRIEGLRLPDGREMPPIPTFATSVLVCEDGRWLLKSSHTSSTPPLPGQ